jgi:hypothetical protein
MARLQENANSDLVRNTAGEDLRAFGYEAELSRKFSSFSLFCLAFSGRLFLKLILFANTQSSVLGALLRKV